MSSAYTSCRHLGNTRVCLRNMRALLCAIAVMPSFISIAHDPWRAMGHMSALEATSEAVQSGAEGCVSASEPSIAVRRGLVLRDVWQRRSPPR
jgi:hypothetical protein